MLAAVLQDEVATWMEYVLGEDFVRYVLQAFEGIRRIGKNDIEFLLAYRQEVEDIAVDRADVVEP